jgi:Putative transposase
VAISNQRLVDLEDGKVRFHWKDDAHGGASKTMTLQAVEFIRRFLLHVLPLYFVRIRHYGFLANRVCQEKLAQCRSLLGVDAASEPLSAPKEPVEGPSTANLCPSCGNGRMVIVETLRPTRTHQGQEAGAPTLKQARFDTS